MNHPPALDAEHSARLDGIIADVIGPAALDVDQRATYPRAALSSLAEAGLTGLLSPAEEGGGGAPLAAGAEVIQRIASVCGSTAMTLLMHYAASAVIDAHGSRELRSSVATGESLSTLAFSETGSRSHFWSPVGTATAEGDGFSLTARKSWVTSAGEADVLVWSSRPVDATLSSGMTLWAVRSPVEGLAVAGDFDGLGLRGNGSRPMAAEDLRVSLDDRLGEDGAGLDIALGVVLPRFLVLNASFSLGLMDALLERAAAHLQGARLEHLNSSLAEQLGPRTAFADLRVRADTTRAFIADTLRALEQGRPDATLRVLQVKLEAAEAASVVSDGVMRLCGGAAFRMELGVERFFRDSLAARVMAPTTDALRDFVGRATLGLPLFDEPST